MQKFQYFSTSKITTTLICIYTFVYVCVYVWVEEKESGKVRSEVVTGKGRLSCAPRREMIVHKLPESPNLIRRLAPREPRTSVLCSCSCRCVTAVQQLDRSR